MIAINRLDFMNDSLYSAVLASLEKIRRESANLEDRRRIARHREQSFSLLGERWTKDRIPLIKVRLNRVWRFGALRHGRNVHSRVLSKRDEEDARARDRLSRPRRVS